MIRYALTCEHEHAFEAWFGSSDDYDTQAGRGLVECPMCGSQLIRKQIMAPAVTGTRDGPARAPDMQAMMMETATRVRKHVEDNFDYVGDRFAREARDIHDSVSPDRGIYGEATPREVRELSDDGIPVAAVPGAPRPKAQLN